MNAMRSSMKLLTCIDNSVVIPFVVAHPLNAQAQTRWALWRQEQRKLVAPMLLRYEVTNVLYRYQARGLLSKEAALFALHSALALPITFYQDDMLHDQAYAIAVEFALPAAYDAHYLALAQRLDADFWTADRRLFDAVHEALPWVQLLQ